MPKRSVTMVRNTQPATEHVETKITPHHTRTHGGLVDTLVAQHLLKTVRRVHDVSSKWSLLLPQRDTEALAVRRLATQCH